jgi:hypothetical protein
VRDDGLIFAKFFTTMQFFCPILLLPLHDMEMRISGGHDGWIILVKGYFDRELSSAPLMFSGATYRHKTEPSRTHSSDYTLA